MQQDVFCSTAVPVTVMNSPLPKKYTAAISSQSAAILKAALSFIPLSSKSEGITSPPGGLSPRTPTSPRAGNITRAPSMTLNRRANSFRVHVHGPDSVSGKDHSKTSAPHTPKATSVRISASEKSNKTASLSQDSQSTSAVPPDPDKDSSTSFKKPTNTNSSGSSYSSKESSAAASNKQQKPVGTSHIQSPSPSSSGGSSFRRHGGAGGGGSGGGTSSGNVSPRASFLSNGRSPSIRSPSGRNFKTNDD